MFYREDSAMKRTRVLKVLIAFGLCVLLSGCVKTWSVTFNGAEDVVGWDILHMNHDNDNWSISGKGLELDGYYAMGPYSFVTADCSLTVVFELHCDWSNKAYLSVELADGAEPSVDRLRLALVEAGDASAENFWVDDSSGLLKREYAPITALNRDGENKAEIIKEGSNLTVKLNGVVLYNSTYMYSPGYVIPYLACYMEDSSAATVYFKSVRVEYDGDMIAR